METKDKVQLYMYRVTHPEHGTVETPAENRLHAVCAAAKVWGVPWTSVARRCEFEQLGPVKPTPEKKPAKPKRAPALDKKESR